MAGHVIRDERTFVKYSLRHLGLHFHKPTEGDEFNEQADLINLYLRDCAQSGRKQSMQWE